VKLKLVYGALLVACIIMPAMPVMADSNGTTEVSGTVPLLAFDIYSTNIGDDSATVSWQTNHVADSQVEYGTTTGYGLMTPLAPEPITDHNVPLTGLTPGTTYHFRVRSVAVVDGTEFVAVSDDFTFTTTVSKTRTVTLLSSSVNPSFFGQPVNFTARVRGVPPGAGSPTGTVNFMDDVTIIGTADLSGNTAIITTSTLSVDRHLITAVYGGDANFTGSIDTLNQRVRKSRTSTVLTSSANPSIAGQPVTFTARVSVDPPGAGLPTGTVTFRDGATIIGVAGLSGNTAIITVSTLRAGSHFITAVYGGDADFNSSIDILNQRVKKSRTSTVLTSSANPSVAGQPVTFTATVSVDPPGGGSPTGTVTFRDGAKIIGAVNLGGDTATFTTTSLRAGRHYITAVYGGDANFNSSIDILNQRVS
jgi:hypothetical protein